MNTIRRTRNSEAGTPDLQTGGGQTRTQEPQSEPAKHAGQAIRALFSRHFAVDRSGVSLLSSVFQCLPVSLRCRVLSVFCLLPSALLHGQSPAADDFHPIVGGDYPAVHALAVQADGSILMGGWFSALGDQPRANLARLNADGTLDLNFRSGANEMVNCFAVQSDGKIVVGGAFSQLGGQARSGVARLNLDGTLDLGFNPWVGYLGWGALAAQPDGKLVVGGLFGLGRLEANGTVDSSFKADANGEVMSLALSPDGNILVGGDFTVLCGQPRTNLARLNPDGTLDDGFDPGPNRAVYALAVQADGKILAAP